MYCAAAPLVRCKCVACCLNLSDFVDRGTRLRILVFCVVISDVSKEPNALSSRVLQTQKLTEEELF
jgi:hypothetical protein